MDSESWQNSNQTPINPNDPLVIVENILRKVPLSQRDLDIIRRHFGLNEECKRETLEEISASYNISRERVRGIERSAIDKIHKHVDNRQELMALMDSFNTLNWLIFAHQMYLRTLRDFIDVSD